MKNPLDNFDPYKDNINIEDYIIDEDEEPDEEYELNEFNSVPTVNKLNGSYGYDDEQWD